MRKESNIPRTEQSNSDCNPTEIREQNKIETGTPPFLTTSLSTQTNNNEQLRNQPNLLRQKLLRHVHNEIWLVMGLQLAHGIIITAELLLLLLLLLLQKIVICEPYLLRPTYLVCALYYNRHMPPLKFICFGISMYLHCKIYFSII